jgi:hypothetical protein
VTRIGAVGAGAHSKESGTALRGLSFKSRFTRLLACCGVAALQPVVAATLCDSGSFEHFGLPQLLLAMRSVACGCGPVDTTLLHTGGTAGTNAIDIVRGMPSWQTEHIYICEHSPSIASGLVMSLIVVHDSCGTPDGTPTMK